MKLTIYKDKVEIKKTHNKERFNNESIFLYYVKNELIKMGNDVIKKRMYKDGHLMGDDTTQYIRERNYKFYIYDGEWQLRFLHKDFNKKGSVFLDLQIN
tara:strand:- start:29 stop:325 length:297 start_codon:yes stop_codon:yes gene_type:complete